MKSKLVLAESVEQSFKQIGNLYFAKMDDDTLLVMEPKTSNELYVLAWSSPEDAKDYLQTVDCPERIELVPVSLDRIFEYTLGWALDILIDRDLQLGVGVILHSDSLQRGIIRISLYSEGIRSIGDRPKFKWAYEEES